MKKEVKTSIDGLEVGMFVSRLDRPWIKTPFDLEGVKITCKEEIERIRKYSNYIYVDVEQGVVPNPRFWILTGEPKTQVFDEAKRPRTRGNPDQERQEYQALRETTYQNSEKFSLEISTAIELSEKLSADYDLIS